MADKQAVKQVDIGKGKDEEKWVKHYSSKHQILLVGEGDFSFSWCLARSFGSGSKIVASSLDSYDDVIQKYKNAKSNLESLKELGASTLHGVDATKMKHHLPLRMQKFDRIIFNFPHAGFYLKEDNNIMIDMHKELVENFFENANDMLQANGEIHVTHKTSPPFCHWNILELARRNYLGFIGRDDFKIEDYPGYRNKRGEGDRCDMHFPLGECGTFKFTSSHTLKRSQQLQGKPMEIPKCQKITFDQGIPTNFIMNSKYFSDDRLTPLAVDFMEGASHSFSRVTRWSNSVNEVPMSECGRHMARFQEVFMHENPYKFLELQRINQPFSNGDSLSQHREIVRRYGQHPEGRRGFG
ncbi:heavy metal-associated isoprenylated plant protein [Salix suchowensis]|nr:heavy metal-associated isoprenylated plant protein [Salix suchowensis]